MVYVLYTILIKKLIHGEIDKISNDKAITNLQQNINISMTRKSVTLHFLIWSCSLRKTFVLGIHSKVLNVYDF